MDTNQKIAEWVGIHYEDYSSPAFPHQGGAWVDSNGHMVNPEECSEPPDFTHSLDALFKWVVPKVTQNMFLSELFDLWIDEAEETESLVLALCYAVEKLIGVTNNA